MDAAVRSRLWGCQYCAIFGECEDIVPGAAACYRDEDHLNGCVCLKLVDGFVAVVAGLFAIDTSERDGGVFE